MTSSVANIVNTTPSVTSDTASKASSSSRSSTTTECSSVEVVVIHDQPEEEEEGIELSLQNFEPNSNYCLRMFQMLPKLSGILVIACVLTCVLIVVHSYPTTTNTAENTQYKYANYHQIQPDPASLPPDTFRKLAQALYQGKANRLQRIFFQNSSITCNDGSVAGYYIRRNYSSQRWIIYLEGGWICHDSLSCAKRKAIDSTPLMSSNSWTKWLDQMKPEISGLVSADPKKNPHFAEANHVFVPYCSSDSWSGTASNKNSEGLTFMGRHIVKEVITELSHSQQLLSSREIFLTGSSAGATGVLVNVDFVSDMVKPHGVSVRGIVDSGWFLDNEKSSPVLHYLQEGVRMWQANVNDNCAKNFPNELWKCFIGYKAFPYIKTPMFIFQYEIDSSQLYMNNIAVPTTQDKQHIWSHIHSLGSSLRKTFDVIPDDGFSQVFSPACIGHTVIIKSEWTQVEVNGVTLPDAINCWASSLPDSNLPKIRGNIPPEATDGTSQQLLIQEPVENAQNLLSNADISRQRSSWLLYNDESEIQRRHENTERYKLASNLVKKLHTVDENLPNNSQNHIRLNTRRFNQHNNNKQILDNRTNSVKLREEKRKKRRRRQRLIAKCEEGNIKACGKIKIRDHNNLNDDNINSDLVRSLDRRSSRKNQNNNNGSSKTKSKKRKLTKAERRERRQKRRERKRQKRRQREKRLKRQQRKREKAEKRKRNNEQQNLAISNNPNPRKKRLSDMLKSLEKRNHGKCRRKYIDTACDFPHCNPSCPKLVNPKTGQEIDTLALLKSFGSDLGEIAGAMGYDIQTLNNMDKNVLRQLLTSPSSSSSQ